MSQLVIERIRQQRPGPRWGHSGDLSACLQPESADRVQPGRVLHREPARSLRALRCLAGCTYRARVHRARQERDQHPPEGAPAATRRAWRGEANLCHLFRPPRVARDEPDAFWLLGQIKGHGAKLTSLASRSMTVPRDCCCLPSWPASTPSAPVMMGRGQTRAGAQARRGRQHGAGAHRLPQRPQDG